MRGEEQAVHQKRATGRSRDAVTSVERDLKVLGDARRYYDWIVRLLRPWFGASLLECGAGSGHVTRRLMALGGPRVLATDVESECVLQLRSICSPPRADAFQLDLEAIPDDAIARIRERQVDTILMVNVLEHISNDAECLGALTRALPSGGRVLLTVPAHPALYSRLDRLYGHHRRYTRADVTRLAEHAGLAVRLVRSMNLPGAAAWWLLHRVLGRESLSRVGTRLFDLAVPIIAAVEGSFPPPFGQSLLVVMERL
jgi:2-polyprenyl-3-methyl-5-hydroxy-6-metoxy-1,4-benzoquinol methylase